MKERKENFGSSLFSFSLPPSPSPQIKRCGGVDQLMLGGKMPSTGTEADAVGALKDVLTSQCAAFGQLATNNNPSIDFSSVEARKMAPRLLTRLDRLAGLALSVFGVKLKVLSAFQPYSSGQPSLLNEGRAAELTLSTPTAPTVGQLGQLAMLATDAGLEYVSFAVSDRIYVSVRQSACTSNLDLVFLVDASGSVDDIWYGGAPGTFSSKVWEEKIGKTKHA